MCICLDCTGDRKAGTMKITHPDVETEGQETRNFCLGRRGAGGDLLMWCLNITINWIFCFRIPNQSTTDASRFVRVRLQLWLLVHGRKMEPRQSARGIFITIAYVPLPYTDIRLAFGMTSFGVDGVVLDWVGSFLSGRTQAVVYRGVMSNVELHCAAVWWPSGVRPRTLLFLLYTADVASIALSNGVSALCTRLYTDDMHAVIHTPAAACARRWWTDLCLKTPALH